MNIRVVQNCGAHRGNLQRTARVPLIALTTFSRADLCSFQVEVRVIINNFYMLWKVSRIRPP